MPLDKKWVISWCFLTCLFCWKNSFAQEFQPIMSFPMENLEVRPSLSYLAPEIPRQNFQLRVVDFTPDTKVEINFVAVMEEKRFEKQQSYITLESPVPQLGDTERSMIQITNEFRAFDRSGNTDLYTGKKLIPAYSEMRAPLFRHFYVPTSGRSYLRPYSSF